MKYMNMDAYRFSISWSRVLPSKSYFVNILPWILLICSNHYKFLINYLQKESLVEV